jgi:hypothetical protein
MRNGRVLGRFSGSLFGGDWNNGFVIDEPFRSYTTRADWGLILVSLVILVSFVTLILILCIVISTLFLFGFRSNLKD